MNILIPVNGFHKGGGNRVLSELANHWSEDNHNVQFLSSNNSDQPYFPTIADVLWVNEMGEPTEVVNKKPRSFSSPIKEQIILYRALNYKHSLGERWDVVLANHSSTAFPVYFSKLKSFKAYYIQAYEPEMIREVKTFKSLIISQLSFLTYNLRLFQIVNSPVYYRYKNVSSNYFVPPGIDFRKYYPKTSVASGISRRLKLGCIGRIEPHKGTLYVLQAFKLLQEQGVDCELHIAFGSIPVEFARLKDIVTIKPRSDSELADFYRNCDIIIAPGTIQFGAPHYPVLEAMAAQTPLITTYYLGCSEQNCWMVAPQSSKDIADKVLQIIANPVMALMKAARARQDVLAYDWTTVSRRMSNLFLENLRWV